MAKQFAAQRRENLLRLLMERGSLTIADAAQALGVSIETVRKDVILLDQEGKVVRYYGGISLPVGMSDVPLSQKSQAHVDEKTAIARHVLELIPEGSSIILDAGSTTAIVASMLAQKRGYTIFVNAPDAVCVLASSDNEVFSMGGLVHGANGSVVGSLACNALATIRADVALMGVDGCSSAAGPAINNYDEVPVKTAMVAAADEAWLLADGSKLAAPAAFRFCTWQQVARLVTDARAGQQELAGLREHVDVEVASL